ncbi:tetratricopeptide repeat protein [bacterium]|nr:tetratricopeptide repeat protein [bacterium]
MKKILVILSIFLCSLKCFAQENIVDVKITEFVPNQQIQNIIKTNNFYEIDFKKNQISENVLKLFSIAQERFLQGNVNASYNEYEKITRNIDSDFVKIVLAHELSKIGFFSLAQDNFDNLSHKYMWHSTVEFIKKTHFPEKMPTKDEEIQLAEYYTDIYYNNLPFETTKSLSKNSALLKKTDYAHFVLAQAYLETKENSKALNSINKAISQNKNNLIYKKYKAQILCEDKKFDDAIKIIDFLVEESAVHVMLQEDMITLKNYILAQAINDKAQSKYYLAKYLFYINDNQRAIKEANTSIFIKKKNPDAYNLLAEIYLQDNKLSKSSEIYQKSYKINKKNPETLLGLGNIEFYWDDYDKALEYYQMVLKRQKNNQDAMLNIAVCYALKKDFKSANSWIKKLLNINPYNYRAYYLLSFVDKSDRDFNLKKSLSINPVFADAWAELAKINLEDGNTKLAESYLAPLEYLSYKNFMYYYCIGLKYQSENNLNEAKNAFEKSLTLYSDYLPAKNALNQIDKQINEIKIDGSDMNDEI